MSALSDPDDLRVVAQWWTRLADVLEDAGRRVGQLAEQVGRDWPDDNGREWAGRTAEVRAELNRAASAAAERGAEYAWRGIDRTPGPRLGETDAARVDDERGMRIAELEPPR